MFFKLVSRPMVFSLKSSFTAGSPLCKKMLNNNYIDLTKQIMIYFIIFYNQTEPAVLSLSDVEIKHPVMWLHIFCSQLQID